MTTSLPEPRWYTIGPHGFYDLVRLARCGRSTLVRVGYLLALFAVMAVVYYQDHEYISTRSLKRIGEADFRREEAINTNARIAERFSIAILVMQNIAVLLLMPIYVASSVHEERDRRTLPLLFTTHLTAREIVLGKWLARVGHVGSILLAGLPILSFVQLWGGIDMPMIAANFINTGCWLVSLGAFSMMMATQSRTLARAVVKTYVFATIIFAVFFCCCTGFRSDYVFLLRPLDEPDGYWYMGMFAAMAAIIHVAHAFFFLWRASHNLEQQRGDDPMPPEVFDVDLDPAKPLDPVRLPPIPDNALVWKERYLGQGVWNPLAALALPFLLCILLTYVSLPRFDDQDRNAAREHFHGMLAAVMLLCFSIYTLLVTYRLSGCIVRERERDTLSALLTLPITRVELLYAKINGNLLRYWLWLVPVAISWLSLAFLSGRNPAGNVLLLFTLAIHLAFFAMLGLFLSVVCRTSVAAHVSLSAVLLLLLIGTLAGPFLLIWNESIITIFNPVACWIMILSDEPDLRGIFVGLTIYAISAVLLCGGSGVVFTRHR